MNNTNIPLHGYGPLIRFRYYFIKIKSITSYVKKKTNPNKNFIKKKTYFMKIKNSNHNKMIYYKLRILILN